MKKLLLAGLALTLTACGAQAGSGESSAPALQTGPPAAAAECNFQGTIDEFYTLPAGEPTAPLGTIVRCQVNNDIPSMDGVGTAYRVLYVTEDPNNSANTYQVGDATTRRLSSGVIFVPLGDAPSDGRKIVAWDHGTMGMGPDCAPSRTTNTTLGFQDMQPITADATPSTSPGFILNMLNNGWVVTATDYAGFGTTVPDGQPAQKPLQYLVGAPEAFDTMNAVRAARSLPVAQAGDTYGVYGQSQGGHAALFTAQFAKAYAPELNIVGAFASDPAAEMQALVAGQWNRLIAWVLGPEVMVAWPTAAPGLNPQEVMTDAADKRYGQMAQLCVTDATVPSGIQSLEGNPFFNETILTNPEWQSMLTTQTPTFDPSVPVAVGQTTNDKVVLASTTALLQQSWCDAGANLRMHWVEGPNATGDTLVDIGNGFQAHTQSAFFDAPAALEWLSDLFAGGDGKTSLTTPCTDPAPQPLS